MPEVIACFTTKYHHKYCETLIQFANLTGVDMYEIDGPFKGAPCVSASHEYHHGLGDSQPAQHFFMEDFYHSLKMKDHYLTVSNPYWLGGGTNKEPIGYTN